MFMGVCMLIFAVYTPPNAADYGYNVFNEETGKSSHVSQASSVAHCAGQ